MAAGDSQHDIDLVTEGLRMLRGGKIRTALEAWEEALARNPQAPRAAAFRDYVKANRIRLAVHVGRNPPGENEPLSLPPDWPDPPEGLTAVPLAAKAHDPPPAAADPASSGTQPVGSEELAPVPGAGSRIPEAPDAFPDASPSESPYAELEIAHTTEGATEEPPWGAGETRDDSDSYAVLEIVMEDESVGISDGLTAPRVDTDPSPGRTLVGIGPDELDMGALQAKVESNQPRQPPSSSAEPEDHVATPGKGEDERHPHLKDTDSLLPANQAIATDGLLDELGDLTALIVPEATPDHLAGMDLDPRATYLFTRIDGTLTIEDLLDISGMSHLETSRILHRLWELGLVRLEPQS